MARPRKQGLDFFPMDVNLFSGKEIHSIQEQYGSDGISFYLYLLCNIFKNGYYLQLDASFFRNVFFDLEMSREQAMSVLEFFLEESLFDMKLFQSDRILTSRSIQLQFQKAVKERAKKNTILIECFWLLNENETETFLKINHTISQNYPDYSGKNPELFGEKPAIVPEKTLNYSGKNSSSSMNKRNYSEKKTGYFEKNPSYSMQKSDYSIEKQIRNNKVYNTISKRAITREERQELIQEFGEKIAEEYIRKTSEYHCCNPETIRRWIAEDQHKHQHNKNMFCAFPQRTYNKAQMDAMEEELLGIHRNQN